MEIGNEVADVARMNAVVVSEDGDEFFQFLILCAESPLLE